MMPMPPLPPPLARQHGVAILTAMLIMVLVTTLAASMAWAQWRQIAVDTAQRDQLQAHWILVPAVDWGRVLLRVDARTSSIDHLGEAWALPLAEARLSNFLSAGDTAADSNEDPAFISGQTLDAQARLNVRNLVGTDGLPSAAWRLVFETLYRHLGLSGMRVGTLQTQLVQAVAAESAKGPAGSATTPLLPRTTAQLVWLGMTQAELKTLAPYIVILPERTPVNINTASLPVLQALVPTIPGGTWQRLVNQRNATPFERINDLRSQLDDATELPDDQLQDKLSVSTQYFVLQGAFRRGDRLLAQQVLLQRKGLNIRILEHHAFIPVSGTPQGEALP